MPTLSKSRFVSGNQCEKKLYFDLFRKELRPQVTEQQQALFDAGHRIGELAHQVFPGGIDATQDMNGDWSLAIERTKQWISEGQETIYEATFSIPGGFAALDILHHENGERWAIEVKSSASVKDYHITDTSFQYFVMKLAGFEPDKVFVMHINNKYVKQGEIDPRQLFHLEDVTARVLLNQAYVQQKHQELLKMVDAKVEPQIEIGRHCSAPFACDYMHHCWAHLPENNIFNLNNARGKDWKLYEQGIYAMSDIPEGFRLNHRQELQVNGIRNNAEHIDSEKIAHFLGQIEGPLYFFDFETINAALPVLNGTRPFEQVPFQYSLHIADITGNIIEHKEFLAVPEHFSDSNETDPRLQLVRQLKNDIGSRGSIIAYNASFEISILNALSRSFPEEKEFIDSLISRFVDLLTPFKSGWFYMPEMGASASIKSVLPSIAPEFSYADLEIGNGGLASNTFLTMIENCFEGDRDVTVKHLLDYCERDTEGMVVIYRHLINMIKS
jgi:hypothetical protein